MAGTNGYQDGRSYGSAWLRRHLCATRDEFFQAGEAQAARLYRSKEGRARFRDGWSTHSVNEIAGGCLLMTNAVQEVRILFTMTQERAKTLEADLFELFPEVKTEPRQLATLGGEFVVHYSAYIHPSLCNQEERVRFVRRYARVLTCSVYEMERQRAVSASA